MTDKARAVVELDAAKARSAELSRSLSLGRCAQILPPLGQNLTS